MFRSPAALFRVAAIAEAITWTLLIAGIIIRATADLPIAVTIGGGIHGFVFLCYAVTAILVAKNQRWAPGATIVAVGSAVIPYATIPTEIWLQRSGRLRGAWRLEPGTDPRDARWHDRLMRWFLHRPWLLVVLLAAGIVAAYVILLLVGPPGGRD